MQYNLKNITITRENIENDTNQKKNVREQNIFEYIIVCFGRKKLKNTLQYDTKQ